MSMRLCSTILVPATLLTTYPPASTKPTENIMSLTWARLHESPSITKILPLSKSSPNSQKGSRTFTISTNLELMRKKPKMPKETKSSWPLLKNCKKPITKKSRPSSVKSRQPKIKKNKCPTWTTKCHKSRAPSTKYSSSLRATRHRTKNWRRKSCTRSKLWGKRKGS